MRVADWSIKLAQEIEAAQGKAFVWAQWDCCQFVGSVVTALTGEDRRDLFPAYETEEQALAIINECGGMEGLLRRAFDEPKHQAFAQRGDIVLCDFGRGPQPAVCVGVWCVAPGERGLEKRMTDSAIAAWTV